MVSASGRAGGKRAERSEVLRLLMDLLSIEGPSGQEHAVAQFIRAALRRVGVPGSAIVWDRFGRRCGLADACGNLVVRLPGRGALRTAARRLFVAHMDTVRLCVGTRPRRRGRLIVPSAGRALGGDDRAGVAIVLWTLMRLVRERPSHPPITALFTAMEEVGLHGARFANLKFLGAPTMGFSFDGGDPRIAVIGAPGSDRMDIRVKGKATHAGGAPEQGVSAAVAASLAIAELHRRGLHGLVRDGADRATSNIGPIVGGEQHNVVCSEVSITAEARAYRLATLDRLVKAYERAFRRAARSVRNWRGESATVEFKATRLYLPFRLSRDSLPVKFVARVAQQIALPMEFVRGKGGLDANWLVGRGIPTVTLGIGAHNVHTLEEYIDLDEFFQGLELAYALATAEA